MKKRSKFRLPDSSNRTTVIGRTGSGKSHFAAWLLSTQNFDVMPWVIVDFKDEHKDIINQIDRVQHLSYSDPIPSKPGIYIIKPMEDDDAFTEWLWRVFRRGYCGLFFDEVFPLGQHNKAFNTIMMQGRSPNIPVIACTQRPTNISVYCFSEASYYFVFDLTKTKDRQTVHNEIPAIPARYELEPYHCYYYDVVRKLKLDVKPAPSANVILDNIDAKIPVQRRTL